MKSRSGPKDVYVVRVEEDVRGCDTHRRTPERSGKGICAAGSG